MPVGGREWLAAGLHGAVPSACGVGLPFALLSSLPRIRGEHQALGRRDSHKHWHYHSHTVCRERVGIVTPRIMLLTSYPKKSAYSRGVTVSPAVAAVCLC